MVVPKSDKESSSEVVVVAIVGVLSECSLLCNVALHFGHVARLHATNAVCTKVYRVGGGGGGGPLIG